MTPKPPDAVSRLRHAFPRRLASRVDAILAGLSLDSLQTSPDDIGPVRFGGDHLNIPFRVYCSAPHAERTKGVADPQSIILACIYSRHHDGFVRERYLLDLLASREAWIPPFVLQLVGEYVLEIVQLIAERVDALRNESYAQFASENSAFLALIRQRVVSYWNCYYRSQFPRLTAYPAFTLLDALGLWGDHGARLIAAR